MRKSNILKLALFATGLSGIVAEYILATLASYFLYDSVMQWALIISVMLFSMGVGSALSKHIKNNLLQNFIAIEFLLSVFVSFSSIFAYSVAAYSIYSWFVIYLLSVIIGVLIGLEIPLVVRLNDEFESLRINIANVIEKDYYGSLVGGLFFTFVGLPYLSLTYMPFVLGFINFSVAFALFLILWKNLNKGFRIKAVSFSVGIIVLLLLGVIFSEEIILHGEQKKYRDKVIFEKQSRYQKIVITQWKDHYWLYINGNQQLSTLDEIMYHEPMVHPVMQLCENPQDILILGGGDGCAAREMLKYENLGQITLVDLDPEMTKLGMENEILVELNQNSLNHPKVNVVNEDGYGYLEETNDFYDIILVDLPDPKSVELSRLYSYEFYMLCYQHLRPNGIFITQAGSPYFATKAYKCIDLTLQEAGFTTVPLHNQIITLGEWGWVLGTKTGNRDALIKKLQSLTFDNVQTKWINNDAMKIMTSFGKTIYPNINDTDSIKVNKVHDPVLYRYYLKGNWDLY